MDVYIGGTRRHLIAQLELAVEGLKHQVDESASYTIRGESNYEGDGDINIIFSDEDMYRDEVAHKILVDVVKD